MWFRERVKVILESILGCHFSVAGRYVLVSNSDVHLWVSRLRIAHDLRKRYINSLERLTEGTPTRL